MREGHQFESIAERRIRAAQDRGEFDDLPGRGRPIPGAGTPDDEGWWVRRWVERQRQDDRGSAEDTDALLGRLWMLDSERAVRSAVEAWNAEHRDQLNADDLVATWRAMAGGRRHLRRR